MIKFLVGLTLGIISGFGVGGGTIGMVYLTTIGGYSHLVAGGINLVYYVFSASPALILHIKNRLIFKKAMIFCSISGVIFSIIGAYFANIIDISILQRFFGIFLIITGINMLRVK